MPTRSLPKRPNLAQLKRQANELHRLHEKGDTSAGARIVAHHPRYKRLDAKAALATPFTLADAQLTIAREYGFTSWGDLKHLADARDRVAKFKPHPKYDEAVAALVAGDIDRLRALLTRFPELVHARAYLEPPYNYFTGATLLHHVAWNPSRHEPVPPNIVDIARLLLDRGSDATAVTLGINTGNTMGLVVTSRMASEANVSGPLIELLRDRGSPLDLGTSESILPDWGRQNLLYSPLANHAPRAAEKLIELGAKPDVCVAAALGRMDLLEGFFGPDGRLRELPRRGGELLSERDAIGLAALFAYVNKRRDALDFLLEKDGNWNMTGVNNGALLHRAAFDGDLDLVKRLVAKGADISNRDNPFNSTPVSWASHNGKWELVDWMRASCRIDIHEAVCHNMYEQVEARLRDASASVNRQLDHWNVPQATPLYWASWTMMETGAGIHHWDVSERERLVRLLLDHGADPNIVAGDGLTALDIAHMSEAPGIAALIEARGGKRSSEL